MKTTVHLGGKRLCTFDDFAHCPRRFRGKTGPIVGRKVVVENEGRGHSAGGEEPEGGLNRGHGVAPLTAAVVGHGHPAVDGEPDGLNGLLEQSAAPLAATSAWNVEWVS